MPPLYLLSLPAFLLGLLLGSFLNVCIARIPADQSILHPRSHCPNCHHTISWYDNLPLLSYLLLRARCRHCQARISWQYPAVELATALWFLPLAHRLALLLQSPASGSDLTESFLAIALIQLVSLALLGLFLIPLIVIDWQTHRLPDAFTLTGIATGLFLICTQTIFLLPGQDQIIFASKHLRLSSPGSFAARGNVFLTGTEALIFGRLLAVCAAALLLLIIRWSYRALRHQDGLGLGDVKLLAMIAAFLGLELTLLTLLLGTLLASLYALYLVARRRATAHTRLPFGSFLGAAALASALLGAPLITWYTHLFR